jgi:hypothetical protein
MHQYAHLKICTNMHQYAPICAMKREKKKKVCANLRKICAGGYAHFKIIICASQNIYAPRCAKYAHLEICTEYAPNMRISKLYAPNMRNSKYAPICASMHQYAH